MAATPKRPSLTEKSAEARSRTLANRDLEDLQALQKLPAWTRYFGRRLTAELESQREDVLYNRGLDKDKLWEARVRFLAAFDVANMLLQDEAGCKSIIGASAEED